MVVNYNDIINAIAKAEDVALYNARSRAIELSNGIKPSAEDNAKAIEIESWIQILTRAAATIDEDNCLDDDIIFEIIQNINELNREVDCDVSRTYSRNASVSGNTNVPSGYVERVLGLYVDNTNPSLPIIRIFVNPATISGNGTEASPFSAIGGGGGSGTVNSGTQYRIAYYAATGTAVSQAAAIIGARALKSDSNGVPTHFDTATEPTLAELAFVKGVTSAIQTQINTKLAANSAITGATKTKITYDANGLVTAGADATTADIADSTNKRYQTDNQNTYNDATSSIQTQLDAKASKTFVESISLQDNGTSIAATTYTIELYANYAYTINELKIIADAGTCTANLKINSTSVTSISAVAVSTSIATATASGANTVAVGDKITLVTTSNSGLNNLQLTIKTTRI